MWLMPLHGRKRLNGGRLSLTVVGMSSAYSAEVCDQTIGQRTAQSRSYSRDNSREDALVAGGAEPTTHTTTHSFTEKSSPCRPILSRCIRGYFETVELLTEMGIALVRQCKPTSGPPTRTTVRLPYSSMERAEGFARYDQRPRPEP